MKFLIRFFQKTLNRAPTPLDFLLLSVFTVLITFNPYYLNHKIDIFELGLYLPGINAVLHGAVPYRDFFHLRGPLELYIPALIMKITKPHIAVLCAYFYFGNVLCLLLTILIAYELLKTRYMFYLMVPAVISRTYPRVMFMIWGGMRYAFGLIAIWCLIKFLKNARSKWMLGAGLATALGLLTSIEIGLYALIGIIAALLAGWFLKILNQQSVIKALGMYALGIAIAILPWVFYSMSQDAFIPYVNDTLTVIFKLMKTIDPHAISIYPQNLPQALAAMLNPESMNFRQMTPSYLYVVAVVYLLWRLIKRKFDSIDLCLLALTIYGFIMYNTAFRGIWSAQFEMALMPEKILYFFWGEALILLVWSQRERWLPQITMSVKNFIICLLLATLFIVSIACAAVRFNQRFFAFQFVSYVLQGKSTSPLKNLSSNTKRIVNIERAQGVVVPSDQADELEAMVDFLKHHSGSQDTVVMFPELGIYNFLADRPFLGRFPIPTFSWFDDRWFDQFLNQLKNDPVRYIFVQKQLAPDWNLVYFSWKPNLYKYAQMVSVIQREYVMTAETPLCYIYTRRVPLSAKD